LIAGLFLRRGERRWQRHREDDQRHWQNEREADQRKWQEQRETTAREWEAQQQAAAQERDRAWQAERDRVAREMQVVRPLDEALVAVQRYVQGRGRYELGEDETRWSAAHQSWEDGWVELTPHLADAELEDRYRSVGTILMELSDRAEDEPRVHVGAMINVAMRAIGNARLALAYWLRGEPLPPSSFPSSEELLRLLGAGDPTPLAAEAPLRTWLKEHEQPPWRADAGT
jgi:hypothetical protein